MSSVSRRAFISASLAAVASLLIRPEREQRRIDLSAFCGDLRYLRGDLLDMRQPFQQNNWTYATDARVCVRVPPQPGDVVTGKVGLPPADRLWFDHDELRGWKEWRGEEVMAMEWCPVDHSGDEEPWIPLPECKLCKGDGKFPQPSLVRLENGLYVATDYYRKVAGLGEVGYVVAEFTPPPVPGLVKHQPGTQCIRFRFDGGWGLQMPIDREAAERDIAEART